MSAFLQRALSGGVKTEIQRSTEDAKANRKVDLTDDSVGELDANVTSTSLLKSVEGLINANLQAIVDSTEGVRVLNDEMIKEIRDYMIAHIKSHSTSRYNFTDENAERELATYKFTLTEIVGFIQKAIQEFSGVIPNQEVKTQLNTNNIPALKGKLYQKKLNSIIVSEEFEFIAKIYEFIKDEIGVITFSFKDMVRLNEETKAALEKKQISVES